MVDLINTIVYAGRLRDKDALISSSSGGAFTALSDSFLEKGDAVVAVIYNYENHIAEFNMIFDKEQREKAKGSKYMQSRPGNIYQEIDHWLTKNPQKKLLFVGMGCQANGFRKYAEIKGFRNQVYIVDIICHGSPSPKLWREYAHSIEQKAGKKISYLTFKDKRNGWRNPTAFAVVNNKEVSLNNYIKVFYSCCALRPACHVCPYTSIERQTDITIGDFWHIEKTMPNFYSPDGTSVFLIHTTRGEQLFNNIKEKLDFKLSNPEQCWQENLEAPTPVSKYRQEFWKDYKKKGINFVMKKYGSTTLKSKLKNRLLKIIGGAVKEER